MYEYKGFTVTVVQDVDLSQIRWPARNEASQDSSLCGNTEYSDLRGLGWAEARRVFALESELIGKIEAAADVDLESESIDEYLYQRTQNLYGLDLGVASTVVCLSAARCIPCSSCNGGAYGGTHHEEHPLVAFFAKPRMAELMLPIAEEARIGLVNGPGDPYWLTQRMSVIFGHLRRPFSTGADLFAQSATDSARRIWSTSHRSGSAKKKRILSGQWDRYAT